MALGFIKDGGESDERADIAEINIIPLVDIMLVLLIIFMVAAPLSISGIGIDLPVSRAKATPIHQDRLILSITKNGEFFFGDTVVQAADLEGKLRAIFTAKVDKEHKLLYIRADTSVSHGVVITAMGAAKLAGVTQMALLTTPPTLKAR